MPADALVFNNEGAINEHDIVMSNSNHNLLYVFNQNPSHTPDSYTLDGTINGVLPIVQTFNGQPVQITSTANSCPVINRLTTGISNTVTDVTCDAEPQALVAT
jgi:hypothetical protein